MILMDVLYYRTKYNWASYTPIYRAPRITGPDSFPPRGPVNRGFTVVWTCPQWSDVNVILSGIICYWLNVSCALKFLHKKYVIISRSYLQMFAVK